MLLNGNPSRDRQGPGTQENASAPRLMSEEEAIEESIRDCVIEISEAGLKEIMEIFRDRYPGLSWKLSELNVEIRSGRKIATATIVGCVGSRRHVDHSFVISFKGDDRYAFANASDYVGTIAFSHRTSKVQPVPVGRSVVRFFDRGKLSGLLDM
jgi:hypothetical protein